jgi:hypothetical protein
MSLPDCSVQVLIVPVVLQTKATSLQNRFTSSVVNIWQTSRTVAILQCLSWQLHWRWTSAGSKSFEWRFLDRLWRCRWRLCDTVYKSTLYGVPKDLNFKPDMELRIHEILRLQQYRFFLLWRVRKITTSDCWLRHVWNNSTPNGRIFMKFGIEYFSKICRENSSFIKIWQE